MQQRALAPDQSSDAMSKRAFRDRCEPMIASLVFVDQYSLRRAFEIFVLSRSEAPQERHKTDRPHRDRGGRQEDQDIHARLPCIRSAFKVTMIDELDIATAAISGVRKPRAASGAAITL